MTGANRGPRNQFDHRCESECADRLLSRQVPADAPPNLRQRRDEAGETAGLPPGPGVYESVVPSAIQDFYARGAEGTVVRFLDGLFRYQPRRMLAEVETTRARIEYLQRIGAWQEMARRLAHEIKNPLTPIQLAVEEIHQRYRKEADFLVLDLAATPLLARRTAAARTISDKLFVLSIIGDDRAIERTYLAGRLAHRRGATP